MCRKTFVSYKIFFFFKNFRTLCLGLNLLKKKPLQKKQKPFKKKIGGKPFKEKKTFEKNEKTFEKEKFQEKKNAKKKKHL